MGSLTRPGLQQRPLPWDPDLDESAEQTPSILLIDNYFAVYRGRRRALISGTAPAWLNGGQPPQARAWRAYQRRMAQEPPWERAERYQQMIAQQGFRSIRAFARATGGNHSRIAKILKILELPQSVLEALRRNADNARLRNRFTERRLRELVKENRSETAILHEIKQVIEGRFSHPRVIAEWGGRPVSRFGTSLYRSFPGLSHEPAARVYRGCGHAG